MTWDWTTVLIALGAFVLVCIVLRWLFKCSKGGSAIGNIAEGIGDVFD